LIDIIRFASSN